MRALIIEKTGLVQLGSQPLRLVELPIPVPSVNEVLIRISACGICHTELDEIEGRTPPTYLPMVPGHQAVGRIVGLGEQVTEWSIGERVGVAWIFSACGRCDYCLSGRENLCEQFQATGRDCNGGYAELMCAKASFVHRIPNELTDVEAAPLLCAGAIGYRSLRLTQLVDGQTLGLTGFGGSAHLVLRLARHQLPRSPVYVFARSKAEQAFAVELGATWVGNTDEHSPILLDAIIDTTPAWRPIVLALENLAPGGRLVINAIRKESTDQSELLRLNYAKHLWLEKEVKSVANVARDDVRKFLSIAAGSSIRPTTCLYGLVDANQALIELKTQSVVGAKVLML